ncbi:MAG: hypothetical protein KDJ52_30350 [Anaerolineae bacterium]|nr:hypothetical protein [Anaerolineae bacterium]
MHLEQQSEELHGFGLFSIHERLIALGGSLQINASPGEGSRFVIPLPLAVIDTQPEPPAVVASTDGAVAQADHPQQLINRPIRALIVDDHLIIIELSISDEPARSKMQQAGTAAYLCKGTDIALRVQTIRDLVYKSASPE